MKYAVIVTLLLLTAACAPALTAKTELYNAQGELAGYVFLTQEKEGVRFLIKITNLPPGVHAFHVHEKGSCTPDFKSAGGHFNPFDKKHGLMNPEGAHAGDLPDIIVNEDGTLETFATYTTITLKAGKKNSLFQQGGTAIVVHEGRDDHKGDPAGNAGPRIACGVIKA